MASRRKKLYAVVWTYNNHEQLPTKKACEERMRTWKDEKEEAGWSVQGVGRGIPGYVATMEGDTTGDYAEAIVLHEYDAETKERIYPELERVERV